MTSDRDRKRKEHEDMRKQRLDEFMTGFSVITTKLKEMYQVNFADKSLSKLPGMINQGQNNSVQSSFILSYTDLS